MLSKIEGVRRQLKKLLDKRAKLKNQEEIEFDDKPIQWKLKGIDKKCHEMKEQMEKSEKKLRASLRALKKKPQKTNKEKEKEEIFKYHNSDDEEDEFYDRTKITQFNKGGAGQGNSRLKDEADVENYDTVKSKLEQLYKQRQKYTEELLNGDDPSAKSGAQEEEEDELEAFMKQNNDKIRLDKQKRLGGLIGELNKEIDKYSKLISMIAPTNLSHRA